MPGSEGEGPELGAPRKEGERPPASDSEVLPNHRHRTQPFCSSPDRTAPCFTTMRPEPGPGVHRLTGASPQGRAGWRRKEAKAPHAPRAEGTATGRHSRRSMGTRGQWALPPVSGGQSIKRAPSPGGTVEGTASRQREGAEAGLESAHCSQAVRSGCGVTVSGHIVTRLENQGSEVTGHLHSEGKSLGVRRKVARQWPGKGRGLRRTAPWEQPVSERYTPARSSEQTRSPQPRSLPSV